MPGGGVARFRLIDPVHGDAFQQHDSRLQQGANVQYTRPHKLAGVTAVLVGGTNYHDNEINVGLYPRDGWVPTGVSTRAHAHVTNAALTLAAWHGWSGSLRMRAVNHYRLDGDDPSIVASGHTVFDLGLAKAIHRGIEFNLSVDNLTNRDYYETQNFFDSRVTPLAPITGHA